MERARVAARSESKKRSKTTGSPPDGAAAAVRTDAPVDGDAPPPRNDSASQPLAPYTVVARRYRPQRFDDVVGQDHVVRALRNAIRLNRLAQAYLFCGTRGVGKTSLARIFAKCLNCVTGPTEEPCQTCDICQSIALGQDVDVIEIDGASNNGVEQVRELRQNAALRPSRARYKIYYIDEVHMLSTGAFNALLKTLEEPPPHVKFLFATTEPGKIPITVLSRCQRYDFAGITPELIAKALHEICVREKVEADLEALQVVARRAGGSLRDAQSLLDRLLASGAPRLTVDVVHGLLGTASDERLMAMIEALADHDSARALSLLEESAGQGIQPVEVLGGLIDFLRDAMVAGRVDSRDRPLVDRYDHGGAASLGRMPRPDAR
jgi:DNA polymerase-3 subunit gamma/tau